MSKIPFISTDEFDASLHYGSHYTGLVDSLGYVYWGKIFPRMPHPAYPNDISLYFTKNTDFVGEPVHVPMVIPEEDIFKQVEVPSEKLMELFTRRNPDGTITLKLFGGGHALVGSEDTQINFRTDYELIDGQMVKTITMEAHDRVTGQQITSKTPYKQLFKYMGEYGGYASFIVGPLNYHLGKHMSEVARFRSVSALDGFPITPQSDSRFGNQYSSIRGRSRFRYGPIPGKVAMPISRVLKIGGPLLSIGGIVYTFHQYREGEISKAKFYSDAVFGVVGFAGPVGMGISLFYFMSISPGIDRPVIPAAPRNWNDISQPRDNTRMVRPPVLPPRYESTRESFFNEKILPSNPAKRTEMPKWGVDEWNHQIRTKK